MAPRPSLWPRRALRPESEGTVRLTRQQPCVCVLCSDGQQCLKGCQLFVSSHAFVYYAVTGSNA